jgi:hypothetical protein
MFSEYHDASLTSMDIVQTGALVKPHAEIFIEQGLVTVSQVHHAREVYHPYVFVPFRVHTKLVALTSQFTSNFVVGAVVQIQTFPVGLIYNLARELAKSSGLPRREPLCLIEKSPKAVSL